MMSRKWLWHRRTGRYGHQSLNQSINISCLQDSSLPIILLHMLLHMLLQSPEPHSHVMAVMHSKCKTLCLSAVTQEASCTSLLHVCSILASSTLARHKVAACTTQPGSELHTCKNLLPNSMHAIKPTKLS